MNKSGEDTLLRGLIFTENEILLVIDKEVYAVSFTNSRIDSKKGRLYLNSYRLAGNTLTYGWVKVAQEKGKLVGSVVQVAILSSDNSTYGHLVVKGKAPGSLYTHVLVDMQSPNLNHVLTDFPPLFEPYGVITSTNSGASVYTLRSAFKNNGKSVLLATGHPLDKSGKPNGRLPILEANTSNSWPIYYLSVNQSTSLLTINGFYTPINETTPQVDNLPVFGFLHKGIIHLLLPSVDMVLIFNESFINRTQHHIEVDARLVPFAQYFDCESPVSDAVGLPSWLVAFALPVVLILIVAGFVLLIIRPRNQLNLNNNLSTSEDSFTTRKRLLMNSLPRTTSSGIRFKKRKCFSPAAYKPKKRKK